MVADYRDLALVCRVRSRLCALPATQISEIMRPLPIGRLPGAPPFLLGVAVIRGAPAPVVDLAQLLDERRSKPSYFVATGQGSRRVALTIDDVIGVRPMPHGPSNGFPSVLESAAAGFVSSVRILGQEALVVLSSGKIVPETAWDLVESPGRAA
jgi:purine-binding chemotaxis protein CheW